MPPRLAAVTLAAACTLAMAARAEAQQVFESVGERALGMGGAFVAVGTRRYLEPG